MGAKGRDLKNATESNIYQSDDFSKIFFNYSETSDCTLDDNASHLLNLSRAHTIITIQVPRMNCLRWTAYKIEIDIFLRPCSNEPAVIVGSQ